MTTSGTSDFNLDFDDLIYEAYERCGIQARTGWDLKTAQRSLNIMFSEWANRGLNLWTIEQRYLTLTTGIHEYDLPDDTVNVLSAVIRTNPGNVQQDIIIDRISRAEYLHIPNKTTKSRPAQFYVERTITPKVYLYPSPDASQTYQFRYYAIRRIQDVGDYGNTADVVFRFLPSLTAGLAYYLALKKAPDRVTMLKSIYEEEFQRAANEDRDIASVFLTPSLYSR
jgi:hypothetical protein